MSKITKPDGSTDGPFGTDTEYNLDEKWKYIIEISNNSMVANEQVKGDLEVSISMSEK